MIKRRLPAFFYFVLAALLIVLPQTIDFSNIMSPELANNHFKPARETRANPNSTSKVQRTMASVEDNKKNSINLLEDAIELTEPISDNLKSK